MKKNFIFLSSPSFFAIIFLLVFLLLTLFPFVSFGQYSLTTTSYSQNFDGLGTNATNTVAGGDLSLINTSLSGWFFLEAGANANTTITANTGSSSTGDTYNYGLSGNSNRSLGGLQTSQLNPKYGFYFTNNTGSTITSLAITYDGETWRVGTAGRSDQIQLQYSTDATSLGTGTWTNVAALWYTNPAQASTGSGSLIDAQAISGSVTGLAIANGANFFIRWNDLDASGSDDGMSVDNFSFTASNTGASPTIAISNPLNPMGGNIATASTNNIISIISLLASNATILPTQAIFTTGGSYANGGTDVSTFKVYQNTTADLSGTPTLLYSGAVNSGSNITVSSGFTGIATGTAGYFIITADVAATPGNSKTVNIAATPLSNFSFSGSPVVAGSNLSAANTFTINSSYFAPGKLAVLRVGDGSTALSSAAAQIQLLQFNTSGTGQTGSLNVTMPVAVNGSNRILTQSGTATSEGDMSLSGDGRYLTLVGYDAAPIVSTGVVASTTNYNGVIGNVDAYGNINTSTYLDRSASTKAFFENNIRSACTADGTGYWVSGAQKNTNGYSGILYVANGATATTGTQVTPSTYNTRTVSIFNNQLYYTTAALTSPGPNYGIYQLGAFGAAIPTSAPQPATNIINDNTTAHTPQEYVIFDLDLPTPASYPSSTDRMLCYLVDEGTSVTGSILKFYSANGGTTWTALGKITGGARAITGTINCSGSVDLYIIFSSTGTTSSRAFDKLCKFTDAAGYTNNITNNGNSIIASSTVLSTLSNTSVYGYGGVCFTPVTDLVVQSGQNITLNAALNSSGTYRNITIQSGGTATLGEDITVIGTVVVANGGTLDCSTYHILSNSDFQSIFTLQSGGYVKTAEANGLAAATYTGSIQTCATRTYSTGANYEFESTGNQITGDGVPATVNNLTISNTSNTSLTNNITVTNLLTIAGNSSTNANLSIKSNKLTISGDLSNSGYGTFTGNTNSNMVINGTGNLTGNLIFAGGAADNLNNFTNNRTGTVTLGSDLIINNTTKLTSGTLAINGYSLTLNGTIDNSAGNTGTLTGDASSAGTSKLSIGGSGDLLGNITFAGGAQIIQNFLMNRALSGIATLGSDLSIGGTTASSNLGSANMTAGALVLNGNTLGLNGYLTGSGTFTGSATSNITIGGNLSDQLGTINFTAGSQILNSITINRWDGTTNIGNAVLGTNLTSNKLNLTYGVLCTGNNLLTIPAYTGAITAPNIPWVAGSASFANSFVATCDASGTPISVANNTTPLTGNYGFQINNVGTGGTTGDVYFPVGASFLTAGTGIATPSPDRMVLNNAGPADNFNVVVNYGDIDNTPNARVSRVWYVNSANSTPASAPDRVNMKLFFVERTTSNWPTIENEVENTPSPFDYTNIALIERDYNSADPNFISIASGSDIQSFPNGTYNNQEVYGQYTVGISPDFVGNTNGIYQFNRFSLTNPGGILLPVKIINFKAYQQGSGVQINWTSINEINIDHYEVQRSADAADFKTIGNVAALNNDQPSINYGSFDKKPFQGNNYYRVKAIGKDGSISYTNIEVVIIGGDVSSLNIFPNPVTNHVFVLQLNNIPAGKYPISIYNTTGQQIFNTTIDHIGGSASQTISLPATIAKGEYYLKMNGSNVDFNKMINVQ